LHEIPGVGFDLVMEFVCSFRIMAEEYFSHLFNDAGSDEMTCASAAFKTVHSIKLIVLYMSAAACQLQHLDSLKLYSKY